MGLLTNLGQRILTGIRRTVEEIRHAWDEIKSTSRDICNTIKRHFEYWRNKWLERRKLRKIKETYHGYIPEYLDIVAAEEAKKYLTERFGPNIGETIVKMSPDERIQIFNEIAEKAQSIMDVRIDGFEFFEPTKDEEKVLGFYRFEDNTIRLNAFWITQDHPEQIKEQVYTIFHELKHAKQWAAVRGIGEYGYSNEQLVEWAKNIRDYIPFTVSDELYRKQPIERDAFGFEALIKGLVTVDDLRNAINVI